MGFSSSGTRRCRRRRETTSGGAGCEPGRSRMTLIRPLSWPTLPEGRLLPITSLSPWSACLLCASRTRFTRHERGAQGRAARWRIESEACSNTITQWCCLLERGFPRQVIRFRVEMGVARRPPVALRPLARTSRAPTRGL